MSLMVTIDGVRVDSEPGWTVLAAARTAGRYVPALCAHPDLPPQHGVPAAPAVWFGRATTIAHDPGAEGLAGCGLCVVEVEGLGQVPACATPVTAGMVVRTGGASLEALRRERLSAILANHPHACLTCAQREGCTREPCSMAVPVRERCCTLLGRCEIQAVAEHVGIDPATPRYVAPPVERIADEPLFDRDPALCVACGRCVRVCHVRDVDALGWVRDPAGRRWVGPLAPTPVEAGCRLCGSCVEVCPTGALLDRGIKPAEREGRLVPCRAACPAGTDVPRYVRLVAQGRFEDAAAVVAERAPLVEVLGQICFHPCEDACRRHDVNAAPVSICRIKREAGAASAAGWTSRLPAPKPSTGKKVAVVGAGPAGLTAAHLLHLAGHRVTVFEARAKVGGMLEYGIPPFRLSREAARRETRALLAGVEVRTGCPIGRDELTIEGLRARHDAVVVATGAPLTARLGVAGEELPGVRPGLEFLAELADAKLDARVFAGQKVVVVGGGNVAMDCARAAARMGAAQVEVICLEKADGLPAWEHEVAAAASEGIRFRHGWGIRGLAGAGKVAGVELKRCTRVFDGEGRFAPVYDENETDSVAAGAVILAIGQRADRAILPKSLDGVFLAGDLATGPKSVVEAIASAREAALAVDRHLGGPGELVLELGPREVPIALGRVAGFHALPRHEPQPGARSMGLWEVSGGLGPDRARLEADRCLRCDLRLALRPAPRPPPRQSRLALDEASVARLPQAEGVLRFYDASGAILEIVGGADMREEARARLGSPKATAFDFEPCPMYTQRQNELLSHFMEAHGKMPPGVKEGDSLDDLF